MFTLRARVFTVRRVFTVFPMQARGMKSSLAELGRLEGGEAKEAPERGVKQVASPPPYSYFESEASSKPITFDGRLPQRNIMCTKFTTEDA